MRDSGGLNHGEVVEMEEIRWILDIFEIDTCGESGSGQKRGIKGNPEFWA